MKKLDWTKTVFVKSGTRLDLCPIIKSDRGDILPEIAVAGRSNVGKSSLLNDIFRSKDLVKTSSVPGKTQLLNFFVVDKALCFADLPGYGYAKVPMNVRQEWGPMIQNYLAQRESLKLLLFLFDIRRMPSDEDLEFMKWISESDKGVILVLTKVDKVKEGEKKEYTKKILAAFGVPNLQYLHYSVPKKAGREPLIHMIYDAFSGEDE